MGPDDPMWPRLQRQLERKGWTFEDAVGDALKDWICVQEYREAMKPRVWSADDITVEEIRVLAFSGPLTITVELNNMPRIDHGHPMMGPIYLKDQEAFRKLEAVQNEVLHG